jgi:hypothetical protein
MIPEIGMAENAIILTATPESLGIFGHQRVSDLPAVHIGSDQCLGVAPQADRDEPRRPRVRENHYDVSVLRAAISNAPRQNLVRSGLL